MPIKDTLWRVKESLPLIGRGGTRRRLQTIEEQLGELKWLIRTATEHNTRNTEINCEISLVQHCNLNCCGCDHFAPLAGPEFADIEETERDVTRLAELFHGHISEFYLAGGEPLLHPEIIRFMEVTRKALPDSDIMIITNGILLSEQPEEFWLACRKYHIALRPTRYPINVNYDEMEERARQYGVEYQYWGMTKQSLKYLTKFTYDLDGRQKASRSFSACRWANYALALEHGKLYTCPIICKVRHFNKYFGTNMRTTAEDSIDIYQAKSLAEVHDFLMHPIPFCKYCVRTEYPRPWLDIFPWKRSQCDIKEWTP